MLPDKVDVTPLVQKLEEKTQAGKVTWEPTASEGTFVAAVGHGSFRLLQKDVSEEWQHESNIIPILELFDKEGKLVWSVSSTQVEGGLFRLYEFAQRVANKVDERENDMLSALDELD